MPTASELEAELEAARVAAVVHEDSVMDKYFLIQHKSSGDYMRPDTKDKCGYRIGDDEYTVFFMGNRQKAGIWKVTGNSLDSCKIWYEGIVSPSGDDSDIPTNIIFQASGTEWGDDDAQVRSHEFKVKLDAKSDGPSQSTSVWRITGNSWDSLKIECKSLEGMLERASDGDDPDKDTSNCLAPDEHIAKVDGDGNPGSTFRFIPVDASGKPITHRSVEEIEADMEALNGGGVQDPTSPTTPTSPSSPSTTQPTRQPYTPPPTDPTSTRGESRGPSMTLVFFVLVLGGMLMALVGGAPEQKRPPGAP